MLIESKITDVSIAEDQTTFDAVLKFIHREEESNNTILRWGAVGTTENGILLESISISENTSARSNKNNNSNLNAFNNIGLPPHMGVAFIIPTGLGARTGGFIGDAGPVVLALEQIADYILVHPNAVNGADFLPRTKKSLYIDGFTLDQLFSGNLRIGHRNRRKIGLIIDRLESHQETKIINAANAVCAVYGIDIVGYAVCKEKIAVNSYHSDIGHFCGKLNNPEQLFDAAERLIANGAEAIAITTKIDGISDRFFNDHYHGIGPNPVGAIESLISRSVTWKTGLPCAHAPVFSDFVINCNEIIDPRAAAEVASGSGLPCILLGLSESPDILSHGGIGAENLSAIIVPGNATLGGAMLANSKFNTPIIAVDSNVCCVGHYDTSSYTNIVHVKNYAEAIAYAACIKGGISWPTVMHELRSIKPL